MNRDRTSAGWSTLTLAVLATATAAIGFALGAHTPSSARRSIAHVDTERAARLDSKKISVGPVVEPDSPAGAVGALDARSPGRTPSDEKALAERIEQLAKREPQRALELAQSEKNRRVRAALRAAALRGWASVAPDVAGDWVLRMRLDERSDAGAAILNGAMNNPGEALRLAARLRAEDPARSADYGQAFLAATANAGQFALAVRFVTESPATPLRNEEIGSAFSAWARYQPEQAVAAIAALTDPALKTEAWTGLTVGWSEADPISLANYAATLPPGETRAQALANALPRWVEDDPVAAAAWIAANDSSPDFDQGVIAVAMLPKLVAEKPETAMSLAQSIADPPLRTNTLRTLALKWAETDAASAARYVQNSPNFSPEERTALVGEIQAPRG